ncbi:PH domain-containing protein [Amycolatopsis alkalitolerans]|uniref:PH domain-containing protein n=1 Tax=Amycolatopsis alkalitolerans TaxID=2547244 RepID=A0A5C4M2R7_9PSEU|nr:PH domain-containing protein [Amycolatopsis alkalitolerans]TNC27301.1 PH domain-containing protein [Amycolatopsis alkalitolerans]
MDNSSASWAPRPALVAVGLLGALVALAGAFLYGQKAGAVLFGVAAVVLAALSAHGLLVRPRLAADVEGLRIRTMRGEHRFSWPEAHTSLRSTKRLGRESKTLEISAGDELFVFGWLELGADPIDVLDVLSALR